VRPLTVLDAAFVHLETPTTPMHVGAVFVLRAPAGGVESFVARLRRHLRARLGASPVFTRCLVFPALRLANPLWVTAGEVDLAWHVQRRRVPRPGGRRELDDCVAALHETALDRTRPLWQLHVLDGLAGGRVALYLQVHHAGFDGACAQAFVRCIADTEPRPRRVTRVPAPVPEQADPVSVLGATLAHQWHEWSKLPGRLRNFAASRSTAPGMSAVVNPASPALAASTASVRAAGPIHASSRARGAPRTVLNDAITGARAFASFDVPLASVRAFARASGVTINDVLLAAVGGALRNWLKERGELPEASLLAAVPVSLRAPGDETPGARVSFATRALQTNTGSPAARLAAIAAATRRAKLGPAAGALPVPDDLPSIGMPWLLGALAHLVGRPEVVARVPLPWNVLVSNVAGPPTPLYVLGARVLSYTPVSIPFHGLALNVTLYSYDGRLYFGLTAARDAVPDVAHLAALVLEELRVLRKATGRRAPPTRPAASRARPRSAA
jgi:WS/DGAT/MGAT family acyltransferase